MGSIDTHADLAQAIAQLSAIDPLMGQVAEIAGMPPLRRREAGFEGLIQIVMAQQLSVPAASAIWGRLQDRIRPVTPDKIARARESTLRACGLSAPKIRTVRAIAQATRERSLLLDGLERMAVGDAIAHLCAVKGIGPWTAEIYLLFCLGHGDVLPSGDLALQVAVQDAMGLEARPNARELAKIAQRWQPWRGVAARLLWSYYQARKSARSGAPV